MSPALKEYYGNRFLNKMRKLWDLSVTLRGTSVVFIIVLSLFPRRSFRLRSNEVSSVSGIEVFRFRVEDKEFKPNPDYWTDNVTTPDGLLYLGVLQEPRAPVYGSKPHFLDCDPSLRTAVEGIREPDRSLDDIIVDIEPVENINWSLSFIVFSSRSLALLLMYTCNFRLTSMSPNHQCFSRRELFNLCVCIT